MQEESDKKMMDESRGSSTLTEFVNFDPVRCRMSYPFSLWRVKGSKPNLRTLNT